MSPHVVHTLVLLFCAAGPDVHVYKKNAWIYKKMAFFFTHPKLKVFWRTQRILVHVDVHKIIILNVDTKLFAFRIIFHYQLWKQKQSPAWRVMMTLQTTKKNAKHYKTVHNTYTTHTWVQTATHTSCQKNKSISKEYFTVKKLLYFKENWIRV